MLDRYEAVGMLIADALGLPLLPARPHALNVDNDAQRRSKELPGQRRACIGPVRVCDKRVRQLAPSPMRVMTEILRAAS